VLADAMKQFDDAFCRWRWHQGLRSSGCLVFPFAMIVTFSVSILSRYGNFGTLCFFETSAGGAHSSVALAKDDKRFKDAS
jgi:hypothetical protein